MHWLKVNQLEAHAKRKAFSAIEIQMLFKFFILTDKAQATQNKAELFINFLQFITIELSAYKFVANIDKDLEFTHPPSTDIFKNGYYQLNY